MVLVADFACLYRHPAVLLLPDTSVLLWAGRSNRNASNVLLNVISEDNPAYHHRILQWVSVTRSCELNQRWDVPVPVAVTLMFSKQRASEYCQWSHWVGRKAWSLSLGKQTRNLLERIMNGGPIEQWTRRQWSQNISHWNGVTSLTHK